MKSPTAALLLSAFAPPALLAQSTSYTQQGTSLGGKLGSSVAAGGDLDGDGDPDVVAGEPRDSTTGNQRGRVRLLTGTGLSLIESIEGTNDLDEYGAAVAFVGDLDIDGTVDFAVGSPGSDTVGTNAGRVRIYSGATHGILRTYDGAAAGDRFGQTVVKYTGTGLDQGTLIGAPFANNALAIDGGAVYRYSMLNPLPAMTAVGTRTGEHLGWSLASADLITGTKPNVIAGAPHYDLGGADQGRVQILNGVTGAVLRTHAGAINHELGYSVLALHDVDGDGHDEYAAGSPRVDFVRLYGGFTGSQFQVLIGTPGSRFGESIVRGVRTDSVNPFMTRPYLAVGAPAAVHSGDETGEVRQYMFVGQLAQLMWTSHFGSEDQRGKSLAVILHTSGLFPTYRIVSGGPMNSYVGAESGRVDLLDEDTGGLLSTTFGNATGSQLGASICAVGDIDADGRGDFVVGAPRAWKFGGIGGGIVANAGEARVVSGGSGIEIINFFGLEGGDELGSAVAAVPDLNGDGRAELLMGAPLADSATTDDTGVAYVRSISPGTLLFTLDGTSAGSEFGASVASGDVNGDGVADFGIGSPGTSSDAGRVRVKSGVNGTTTLLDKTGGAGDRFGQAIAMGDLTGDGRADLVVGVPFDDGAISNIGSVQVYQGNTGLLLWSRSGTSASDRLSESVAIVGDTDGDGFVDLAVGAPHASLTPGDDAGYVRLYRGVDGLLLRTFSGATDNQLGSALSGAGDVDLDGKADLLIGAAQLPFLTGALGTGFMRVHSGADGHVIVTSVGTDSLGAYGGAVAGIGDATGDGVPDAAVGAPFAGPDTPWWVIEGAVSLVSLRPAGLSLYGPPVWGCNGNHAITMSEIPKIGSATLEVRSNRAPANSMALLLAGSQQNLLGTDYFSIGIKIFIDLATSLELYGLDHPTNAAGFAETALPIPNVPALVGQDYFLQAIYAWPQTCTNPFAPLSSTNGMKVVIQAP